MNVSVVGYYHFHYSICAISVMRPPSAARFDGMHEAAGPGGRRLRGAEARCRPLARRSASGRWTERRLCACALIAFVPSAPIIVRCVVASERFG